MAEKKNTQGYGSTSWTKVVTWKIYEYMKDNIKMDIKEAGMAWNGLMWHRLRTSSGLW